MSETLNAVALEAARKAVEDVLVEFRDSRISVFSGNGFVINEPDGKQSWIKRLTTKEGLETGIAAYLAALQRLPAGTAAPAEPRGDAGTLLSQHLPAEQIGPTEALIDALEDAVLMTERAGEHLEAANDIIEADVPGIDEEDVSDEREFIADLRTAVEKGKTLVSALREGQAGKEPESDSPAALPPAREQPGDACPTCDGMGSTGVFLDGKRSPCISCDGTGRRAPPAPGGGR